MSTPAPAVLILLQHGISGAELARQLGISRQAVSLQLRGETSDASTHDLLELLEDRYGYELASAVSQAIDRSRDERINA